jgi:hypothetical protein
MRPPSYLVMMSNCFRAAALPAGATDYAASVDVARNDLRYVHRSSRCVGDHVTHCLSCIP